MGEVKNSSKLYKNTYLDYSDLRDFLYNLMNFEREYSNKGNNSLGGLHYKIAKRPNKETIE